MKLKEDFASQTEAIEHPCAFVREVFRYAMLSLGLLTGKEEGVRI